MEGLIRAVNAGYDADMSIADYDEGAYDISMVWKWASPDTLEAGETVIVSMAVVMDETAEGSQDAWLDENGQRLME